MRLPAARPGSRFQRVRRWLMMLACGLLGVNIIMGTRVSIDSLTGHREAARERLRLEREIENLRRDNRQMRDRARKLREDPNEIEAVARRELGLIRRGEILFLLADAPLAKQPPGR